MRNYTFILLSILALAAALLHPSPYRYRFPIYAGPDAMAHLRDQEARVKRLPTEALEKATLASLLAAVAKTEGDPALYDRAEMMARESLRQLPDNNAGAKMTLARVAEARHRFPEAIRLGREVANEGKMTEALSLLATCHLAMGDLVAAHEEAARLVDAKPSLASYALLGLVLAARGEDGAAETSFAMGIRLEDLGDTETSAWTRALLARHFLKSGRLREARGLLEEALRIVPDYHFAHDLLGQLALQKSEYPTAAREFGAAFASSKQVVYLRHHAHALRLLGNLETAEVLHAQAERTLREELRGGEYGHRLELALLLLDRATASDITEAVRLARADWAARPAAETGYVFARALLAAGEKAEAAKVMGQVLTSGARDARYFTACAEISRANGRETEATQCSAQADRTNRVVARLTVEKKGL